MKYWSIQKQNVFKNYYLDISMINVCIFFKRATSKNISLVKFNKEVGTCVYKIGSTIFKRGSPSNANEQKIQAKKYKTSGKKRKKSLIIRLDKNGH